MRKFNLILICLVIAGPLQAQSVAINTDGSTANASSILDVKSTTAGVLLPRMTQAQRDVISTPATGLLIYQTDNTPGYYYYSGTNWTALLDSNSGLPPGAIMAFGGSSVPSGWFLCDGSAVSRTTYSNLFAAISINWGTGDGINTFNLPDLRGRFLRGMDGGVGNDPDAATRTALLGGNTGDNVGSYQDDATSLPSGTSFTGTSSGSTSFDGIHIHTVDEAAIAGNGANTIATNFFTMTSSLNTNSAGSHSHTTSGNITVTSGGDAESRPINASVKYIIKY